MSQPKMTSQKPKPPSTALQNLSSDTYLPRRTPSTSKPPILTFFTPCSSNFFFRAAASMAARYQPFGCAAKYDQIVLAKSGEYAGACLPGCVQSSTAPCGHA